MRVEKVVKGTIVAVSGSERIEMRLGLHCESAAIKKMRACGRKDEL